MSEPAIAIILPVFGDFRAFTKTLQHLHAQTLRDQLEIVVVVTPVSAPTVDESLLTGFHNYQVITIPVMPTGGDAFAAGILAAHSRLVTLAEDHSFAESTWAEAMLSAHEGDYSAVSPAMANGNPDSLVSWGNFLLCFIEWFDPPGSGNVDSLPGHNAVYKRAALLPFESELNEMLRSERMLHYRMRMQNQKLYMAAQVQMNHVNISRLRPFLDHSFHGGRIFGALRAREWSLLKRLVYTLAAPLVPLVRQRRIYRTLAHTKQDHRSLFFRALPLTSIGLCAHALGEVVGYHFGTGNSQTIYLNFELDRRRFLLPEERELFER